MPARYPLQKELRQKLQAVENGARTHARAAARGPHFTASSAPSEKGRQDAPIGPCGPMPAGFLIRPTCVTLLKVTPPTGAAGGGHSAESRLASGF